MSCQLQFVQDACKALRLPAPPLKNQVLSEQARHDKDWKMHQMPMPKQLNRDTLWTKGLPRPQLEFVVDNQAVAEIANGTGRITNDRYKAPLSRIQTRLRELYSRRFEYKAGFLDPVDWRPREFNSAADHAANCVIVSGTDIDTTDQQIVRACLDKGIAMQIFYDGEFVSASGRSSAAFVVVGVWETNEDI